MPGWWRARHFAGMLWSKQFYHYVVNDWLEGDPALPSPPPERRQGRNHQWTHLFARDVISMPDKWEFPWFAAWDLGFHCVTLAHVDPQFAKEQILLMLREWYMHPNGQIPPTSGTSATSTRRCSPWPRSRCSTSSAAARGSPTTGSSSASSTRCS